MIYDLKDTRDKISKSGFTLMEILVVTSMLAVISLAVFTTLNSGLKLWQLINQQTKEEDIALFFFRISSDLRNSFIFSEISFSGDENSISFPTLLRRQTEFMPCRIGQANYFWDEYAINVVTKNYSEIYQKKAGVQKRLLSDVRSLSFYYYYYHPSKESFLWTDTWPVEDWSKLKISPFPLAVKVELSLNSDEKTYSQIISIPASG